MWWIGAAAAGEVCSGGCLYDSITTGLLAGDTDLTLIGPGPFDGFTYTSAGATLIHGDGTQTVHGPIVMSSGTLTLEAVTIDGVAPGALVTCAEGLVTLLTVTVDGGSLSDTVEIEPGCVAYLVQSEVKGFVGPAVHIDGGELFTSDTDWQLNADAAISLESGGAYLGGGTISGHSRGGKGGGGAIDVAATDTVALTVADVTFSDNLGDNGGAIGVSARGETVTVGLQGNTYLTNSAGLGGAVYLDGVSFGLEMVDETYIANAAGSGADLYITDSKTDLFARGTRHCGSVGPEAVWVDGKSVYFGASVFLDPAGSTFTAVEGAEVSAPYATVVWSGASPLADGTAEVQFDHLLASATGGSAAPGTATFLQSVFDVGPGVGGVTVSPIEWLAGTSTADEVCGHELRPARAFATAHDFVGAAESLDSRDLYEVDADYDLVPFRYDCDDTTGARSPDVPEVCGDDIDQDCDGVAPYVDVDRDGHGSTVIGACGADATALTDDDCDDGDATAFPGALDVPCDGVDQDCVDGDDCPPPITGDTAAVTPDTGAPDTAAGGTGTGPATIGGSSAHGGDTGSPEPPDLRWSIVLGGGCATGGAHGAVAVVAAFAALRRARRPTGGERRS